jgi:c-di-GMP-binding flagellar brake protein YcgR
MLRDVLSLGDKIDIRLLDHNGRPHNGRTLVSQLVDFVDLDVINIAAPIVYGKTILLHVGESYNLCFYTEKGLYQCNCVLLSNHKDSRTVISMVRIVTNLEKFQRRQYFRLECILDIEYRIITIEEEMLERKMTSGDFGSEDERTDCETKLKQFEREWINAVITDISGGGARFNSAQQHNPGEKVRIKLGVISSGDMKGMILNARIVTSDKILTKFGSFEHRVEFADIMQRDRETLIRYIFEQERKRRRNDKS